MTFCGKEEQRRKRALIFAKNRSKRYKACSDVVPLIGLEPIRSCPRGILSPLCLPIPPQRHGYTYFIFSKGGCQHERARILLQFKKAAPSPLSFSEYPRVDFDQFCRCSPPLLKRRSIDGALYRQDQSISQSAIILVYARAIKKEAVKCKRLLSSPNWITARCPAASWPRRRDGWQSDMRRCAGSDRFVLRYRRRYGKHG